MRECGVLLPIFSIPSKWGIGGFSKEAYEFVDQLVEAGQKYWQVLPLGPTSYGDSPYQSFSTFAGNPYFISVDQLMEEGLLTKKELQDADCGQWPGYVDYERIYHARYGLLRNAYERFDPDEAYGEFLRTDGWWLEDYCLFMTIKNQQDGVEWMEWPDELKYKDWNAIQKIKETCREEMDFYRFMQYEFHTQWRALKEYANEQGIRIIGDVPIYVAKDSVETWMRPDLFQLDENLKPSAVAGCPPDAFDENGQLWGNPLYRWDKMRETGYDWWVGRVSYCFRLFDVLRIDHFRGFDEYFSVPAKDETAKNGHWEKGPGMELFRAIRNHLNNPPIIAEDLGFMTDSVRQLLKDSEYPGMKVIEFAFNPDEMSEYLPHNYNENSVVYTGTHDNTPLMAWVSELDEHDRAFAAEYAGLPENATDDDMRRAMIRLALSSASNLAVIPMQDYLGLGAEARVNHPSTIGENWKWRLLPGQVTKKLLKEIHRLTSIYGRG